MDYPLVSVDFADFLTNCWECG